MDSSNKSMTGKVALITGAGKGIGKEISEYLSGKGITVACCSRNIKDLELLHNKIKQMKAEMIFDSVDVCDFSSIKSFVSKIEKHYGRLDFVFINAGITIDNVSVEESDIEKWENVIKTNLIGAFYTAKAAIPLLKKAGSGKILTTGSGLGHKGSKGTSAYSCSKAGLWMLTRLLAQELIEYNISVNELVPGPVNTNIDDNLKKKHSSTDFPTEWYKETKDLLPIIDFLINQPDIGPTAQSYSMTRREL